jgi:transposase
MTQNRMLTMSTKEIERCEILKMVEEKKITQKAGARKIAVSERQFRRLLSKYRRDGPQGMISGHRCKPSNNRMLPEKREAIIEKLRTEYADFGATLASEKLGEREGIEVSKETVRQIMIQEGLHQPKKRKEEKVRQMRERRKHRGELVQIDGSYHAWLEDRAGKACLILFVDDATSEILAGEFVEHESFFAYARVCKHYFQYYGLPEAF